MKECFMCYKKMIDKLNSFGYEKLCDECERNNHKESCNIFDEESCSCKY